MSIIKNLRMSRKIIDIRGISKKIEAAYLAQADPPDFKTKTNFSASAIGYNSGRCARRWVMSFRGANFEATADAKGMALMASGHDSHERIQGILEKAGLLLEAEVVFDTENPRVRGFIDAFIEHNGEEILTEIKTTMSSSFVVRQNSNAPMYYHRYQILIYMWAKKKDKALFIYENRDTKELLLIPIEMNETNKQILDEALDWMREVEQAFNDGQLPTRGGKTPDSVICQQCPVKKDCWTGEDEGVIKIKNMKIYK